MYIVNIFLFIVLQDYKAKLDVLREDNENLLKRVKFIKQKELFIKK
jgi:hypothetical protein